MYHTGFLAAYATCCVQGAQEMAYSSHCCFQVLRDVLCNTTCDGSSANAFAWTFTQENITLSTAHLLSIMPDGESGLFNQLTRQT